MFHFQDINQTISELQSRARGGEKNQALKRMVLLV